MNIPIKLSFSIIFLILASVFPHVSMSQECSSAVPPKYEVRAVWLTTLGGLDWPERPASGKEAVERQKKELTDILDKLVNANINTVLLQTRVRASVIYPSEIEPWDGCISGTDGKAAEYDPLAFAVEECHKRGLEIQAWVVAVPVGRWNSYGCKALRKKHPRLVVRRGNNGYMNPADPQTAVYISGLCREIVSKYDVDGIHLDYIRYPETWKPDISLYAAQQNITNIVRSVYGSIKSVKPWVKLSCAAIGKYSDLPRYSSNGWNALVKGCQDVQAWMRLGIIDQAYPMAYFKGNQFYPFVIDWSENSYGRTVVAGLGAYCLSQTKDAWPVDEIERQMYVSRNHGMGFSFFREKFLRDDVKGLYGFTKDMFCRYPALIPPMTWACADKPCAPSGLQVKYTDSCTAVAWDSVTGDNGGLAYNVYASHAFPVDVSDVRNLIVVRERGNKIRFKASDRLFFAVTSIDRYGNESLPVQQEYDVVRHVPDKYISNDGKTMTLPDFSAYADVKYVLLKSLTGSVVSVLPCKGREVCISSVPEGCNVVYSLNDKGIAHRLGYVFIRRKGK